MIKKFTCTLAIFIGLSFILPIKNITGYIAGGDGTIDWFYGKP